MTLGLAPVSNDSNMTLNTVFSLGFSYTLFQDTPPFQTKVQQLTSTGSSAAAVAGAAAGAAGMTIS